MKILFLEDDPIIAEIVNEYLESQNYITDYAFDMEEAKEFIKNNKYNLFLLDVNVPGGNSFELLDKLRKDGIKTPAIFITALNTVDDMKKGFQSGCDDYIKKPFELEELEIRLNNIKRLYNLDDIINIDKDITLDKSTNILKINNQSVKIREKEVLILNYLAKNYNKTVSNDELCHNIWEYDNMPSDATIRTYIKNLRNQIGSEKIETIKGIGYRFIKS